MAVPPLDHVYIRFFGSIIFDISRISLWIGRTEMFEAFDQVYMLFNFSTSMSCFLHEKEQPVERCSGCHSNGLTGLGSFNICTWILVTAFAIPSITAKSEDVCHIVGQRTWRMPRGCTLYAFLPPRSTYTYARDLRFVLHPLCESSPGLGQQKYYPFYEAFSWNVLMHLDLSRKPSDSLSLHDRYLLVTP